MVEPLNLHIEALLFCADSPSNPHQLTESLSKSMGEPISPLLVETCLGEITLKYQQESYPMELVRIAGGYQFLTKKEYARTVSGWVNHKNQKRLSVAAMETLAIVAYRQPVTKSQIEDIRGVNCDYSIQKLLEKELISIDGKTEGPGRPILYSTSRAFMEYFKLDHLHQLPDLKDLGTEPLP